MAEETNINAKQAIAGINLDSITSQVQPGQLTWATNAVCESFDGRQYTMSNEQGNVVCVTFPSGYQPIGVRNILEEGFIMFWLANPTTGGSEIGQVRGCTYSKLINADCLGFSVDYPILKHAHRNTNCGLEVYWVESNNRPRYIQFESLPYKEVDDPSSCKTIITSDIDCNKLNLQPDFSIPTIDVRRSNSGGDLKAGTYQFTVQYGNALSEPYTSFYNVTNPVPVFIGTQPTQDFDFPVNKAIALLIADIDTTGIFDYFNVAVIKTINLISSVELVGTYKITDPQVEIIYTGAGKTDIQLDINDIKQKYQIYDLADDLTTAQDTLILAGLSANERISYQEIANQIHPQWATRRMKGEAPYADVYNASHFVGYMRDEIYPLELQILFNNGYGTDGFTILGRRARPEDIALVLNDDIPSTTIVNGCEPTAIALPRWRVYNTATVLHSTATTDDCYEGEWQYGDFAYWESLEKYPCNDIYGDSKDTPIRHHKFPDCIVSPIHDEKGYIYPIGIRIDVQQVVEAIKNSSLTAAQKANIAGFKIVRGNRANNESIKAKGLITNVLKYSTTGNIIDATTGGVTDGEGGAEASVHKLLDSAFNFTEKARGEYRALYFLTGALVVGPAIQQNARYHFTLNLIDSVRTSPDLFTELNVSTINHAIEVLGEIQGHSGIDSRGKAHSQAAQAILQGVVQIMQAQIELIALMAELDNAEILTDEANKFRFFPNYLFNDVHQNPDGSPRDFFLENTIIDEDSKKRWTLHSPDTSFYQPSLGNILKLETAEWGVSGGHIVEVKKHARYQFISTIGYITAVLAGVTIGFGSGSYGIGSVNVFNGEAAFTAYQAFLDILYKTVPHKNFAYQFNAVGQYTHSVPVPNDGNKQRGLDISIYLNPGLFNVGDKYTVNNYQREGSVYLRSDKTLPYPHEIPHVPADSSKLAGATFDVINTPVSAFYASLKSDIENQYGQLYSYTTIDTGYYRPIDLEKFYEPEIVFGGDTFINRFAYKSKIPFFIDNRVDFPDNADISYNELSNVGRVKYWFSTDVTSNSSIFDSFFATMTQHFFWPRISELYLSGIVFLFAYGIPYFYCESGVNVDLRQAFNTKEGDFFPRVSSGIPDEWLQEINTTIQQDNSYWYNKTFSKQNTETNFTHLPDDYDFNQCRTVFPYRAIFSEQNTDSPNPSNRNNWRIFKPAARFDFPQNYGRLTSLDGIETRQVLARFENKTLLYNALLTAPTSAASVYLGQSLFKSQVPPLDYAETDLGYMGSQHKFLLKTEYGDVSVDAKRGQVFLIQGQKADCISDEYVSKFITEFMEFQIVKTFPTINIDNHFKGIGLHGVYDDKHNRLIITKLDYKPLVTGITYDGSLFRYNSQTIGLSDTRYFANYSFTISYSFNTKSWVSLHTYLPNFYVGENNFFYSGRMHDMWTHNTSLTKFNSFYDAIHPYVLEYPYSYKYNDEILQCIKDYSNVLQFTDFREFIETDEFYFNKLVAYSTQQSTGVVELVPKPKNNLQAQKLYPIYNTDSKTVLVTKSGSFYNVNTFWDTIKDVKKPVWNKSNNSISEYKALNQANHNYNKLSYNKAPMRSKDLRIRLILDDRDDIKIISNFTVAPTMQSYK